MFTIKTNNKELVFESEIRVKELINDVNKEFPVAKVNNRLRELSYKFNYDADVEFLTLSNREAVLIYEISLRFLIAMAFKNIYPDYKIRFKYSLSRSIFCYITNKDGLDMGVILETIETEMERLIDLDLPFERITVSAKEALDFYNQEDYQDRIDILEYRPESTVHFYKCDGYQNYMYGYMVPSTGYLSQYKLRSYEIGFIIQFLVLLLY